MQVLLLSNCNPHDHRTNICETNMVMTKLITHQNVQPWHDPKCDNTLYSNSIVECALKKLYSKLSFHP
jgi:hypothetical protein